MERRDVMWFTKKKKQPAPAPKKKPTNPPAKLLRTDFSDEQMAKAINFILHMDDDK